MAFQHFIWDYCGGRWLQGHKHYLERRDDRRKNHKSPAVYHMCFCYKWKGIDFTSLLVYFNTFDICRPGAVWTDKQLPNQLNKLFCAHDWLQADYSHDLTDFQETGRNPRHTHTHSHTYTNQTRIQTLDWSPWRHTAHSLFYTHWSIIHRLIAFHKHNWMGCVELFSL